MHLLLVVNVRAMSEEVLVCMGCGLQVSVGSLQLSLCVLACHSQGTCLLAF